MFDRAPSSHNSGPRLGLGIGWGLVALGLHACGSGGGGQPPGVAAPTNLVFAEGEVLVFASQDLEPLVPTYEGGVDSFTITPELPPGLTLDPLLGTIQGHPVSSAARRVYHVRATNAGGTASANVALTVVAPARFAYVTSSVDDSVAVFATEFASGALTRRHVAAPEGATHDFEDFVVHPSGQFAYATGAAQDDLTWFELGADSGHVAERGTLPLGPGPHAMAIHPSGRWLWVTNQNEDRIRAFEIDALSGEPVLLGSSIPTGSQPAAIVVDAQGTCVFVAARGLYDSGLGSSLLLYRVNGATGALTSNGLPLRLNGGQPTSLAVDPTRDLVLVALDAFDDVLPVSFDRTNGHMTPEGLRDTGINPGGLVIDPRGRLAYLVNRDSNTISAFRIDASGSLGLVQTIGGGSHPRSITLDPGGRFAYVAASERGQLLRFAIDSVSGALAPLDILESRAGCLRIAFSHGDEPLGWEARYVHATNEGSDDTAAFAIDDTTGALTAQPAAASGDAPIGMVVNADTGLAWVASRDSRTLEAFRIDAASGALTSLAHTLTLDSEPTDLVLGPTGRFLYVATTDGSGALPGNLLTYAIDPAEGELTLLQVDSAGLDPRGVAIDPTGTFLYVANRGDGGPGTSSVSVFALALKSGLPTLGIANMFSPGALSLSFAPSGRCAYGSLANSNGIALFSVNRVTGRLDLVPSGLVPGEDPRTVAFTPDGRFAYAAFEELAGAGAVAVYAVAADGALGAPIQLVPNLAHPRDLAVEDSGRFLYVASRGADVVAVATIDRATGLITLGIPVSCGGLPSGLVVTSVTR